MEKIYHANVKQNKAGMVMSTSNIKCQMNSRKLPGIKKGHYIMLKRAIHQEDIILLNFNAPNKESLKYVRQKLKKKLIRKIDEATVKF